VLPNITVNYNDTGQRGSTFYYFFIFAYTEPTGSFSEGQGLPGSVSEASTTPALLAAITWK
jgi:hypothetical protein